MRTNFYALTRRQALASIGTAALAGSTAAPATPSGAAVSDVSGDLAHIGSRVYSEEGVAMFLACENVAAIGSTPQQSAASSALNRKVASAFQRYSREWQHAHPDAPAGDVAKILEFIADRDFSSGGQEPSL